jgi:hypothetical protein
LRDWPPSQYDSNGHRMMWSNAYFDGGEKTVNKQT